MFACRSGSALRLHASATPNAAHVEAAVFLVHRHAVPRVPISYWIAFRVIIVSRAQRNAVGSFPTVGDERARLPFRNQDIRCGVVQKMSLYYLPSHGYVHVERGPSSPVMRSQEKYYAGDERIGI